ncbi:helix-turn-helix domain-containing protein [Undibacterium sp. MH2W]|uniref:helix-turn-helix domain-containing protein n=1 Tax=Undibacterium sp. MH2W TaxID=3413044 RepID=UPI003BF03595
MNIAHNIDVAMRSANIKSHAELSRRSGVPESSLSRILKGAAEPSIANLALIADACNTTIDILVTGTEKQSLDLTPFPLMYVSQEEVKLLTQFREASKMGKQLIKTAASTAEKESSLKSTN